MQAADYSVKMISSRSPGVSTVRFTVQALVSVHRSTVIRLTAKRVLLKRATTNQLLRRITDMPALYIGP